MRYCNTEGRAYERENTWQPLSEFYYGANLVFYATKGSKIELRRWQ